MSIKVQGLSKIYGNQKAVDDISFEASKGQILGFLGPNGAGKTTTMKVLTCFIPQSSGKAFVCGYDTEEHSMEVRRRIGYLPEHNPLYKDMYVREYLHFIAGLHRLAKPKSRIDEMIEMTGLVREQKKLIGALSKGYRQRVGLAQAMMHDPEVLILDEPTSGLDPNQLAEIRGLITRIGKEKTVLFSTHIMQEVQALCDWVVIINQGKIVANDRIESLQQMVTGELIVRVEFQQKVSQSQLQGIRGVKKVKALGEGRWQLSANQKDDIRKDIFQFAVSNNLILLGMQQEVFSVEDVFQQLTK